METTHAPGALVVPAYAGATPPGMEDVVQRLKKDSRVSNPWALAWWMKNRQLDTSSSDESLNSMFDTYLAQAIDAGLHGSGGIFDESSVFSRAANSDKNAQESCLKRENFLDMKSTVVENIISAPITMAGIGVEMPEVAGEHPNRLPFSGILTRLDEPSDRPPSGSQGHRVLIPSEVARESLSSLIGMGVDVSSAFDGHDSKKKIGIFTDATIDGKDLRVKGHLFAKDFPEEIQTIQTNRGALGLSFEISDVGVIDPEAEIWELARLTFTGAAILKKKSAAYSQTAIAARHEKTKEGEKEMARSTAKIVHKKTGDLVEDLAAMAAGLRDIQKSLDVDAEGKSEDEDEDKGTGTSEGEMDKKQSESGDMKKSSAESDAVSASLGDRFVAGIQELSGSKPFTNLGEILDAVAGLTSAEESGSDESAGSDPMEMFRSMMESMMKSMGYHQMKTRHDDEAEDIEMLRRLTDKYSGRGMYGKGNASRKSLPSIADYRATRDLEDLRAAMDMITDTQKTVISLLTDAVSKNRGLVTDSAEKKVRPGRKTMTGGSGEAWTEKNKDEEVSHVSFTGLSEALQACGLDTGQRMQIKLMLPDKGFNIEQLSAAMSECSVSDSIATKVRQLLKQPE